MAVLPVLWLYSVRVTAKIIVAFVSRRRPFQRGYHRRTLGLCSPDRAGRPSRRAACMRGACPAYTVEGGDAARSSRNRRPFSWIRL